jgi:hypothetical protein
MRVTQWVEVGVRRGPWGCHNASLFRTSFLSTTSSLQAQRSTPECHHGRGKPHQAGECRRALRSYRGRLDRVAQCGTWSCRRLNRAITFPHSARFSVIRTFSRHAFSPAVGPRRRASADEERKVGAGSHPRSGGADPSAYGWEMLRACGLCLVVSRAFAVAARGSHALLAPVPTVVNRRSLP